MASDKVTRENDEIEIDIKPEDFELVDYDPVKPQLKFDLAI